MLILPAGTDRRHTEKEPIMLKSLKKTLAGTALVAAIALGGAGVASAETAGPVTTTVPPGGRACVVTNQRATYQVRADGTAPNAVGSTTQWSMANSFDGVNFNTIPSQTLNGNYYGGVLQSSTSNYRAYFPSYWKFCVRNSSTTANVKATLTLRTDSSF
jgi:hypothetical protein